MTTGKFDDSSPTVFRRVANLANPGNLAKFCQMSRNAWTGKSGETGEFGEILPEFGKTGELGEILPNVLTNANELARRAPANAVNPANFFPSALK